jgi:hypothetical protein
MARLVDIPPDKIRHLRSGQWLFVFAGGWDENKLPIGAEYVMVYSPTGSNGRWEATHFRVVPVKDSKATSVQVIEERELTAEEIGHFRGLIARQG